MSARRNIYRLHKWLGLVLAAWLLMQALTGLLLTLHDVSISAARQSACRTRVDAFPWQRLLRSDGERIVRVDVEDDALTSLRATVLDREGARHIRHVSVCTGEITDANANWEATARAAIWLHGTLVPGAVGEQLIGILGALTLVALVAGLWLWWPASAGSFRNALTVPASRHGLVRLRGWHRVGGALSSMLLVISVVSGIALAYTHWLVSSPRLDSKCNAGFTSATSLHPYLSSILRAAQEEVAGGVVRSIRLEEKYCLARVYVRSAAAVPESLTDRIWLQLPDASVVAHRPAETASAGHRTWAWSQLLHTGDVARGIGRVLLFATGLSLMALTSAGFAVYLWSNKKNKAHRSN